MNKISLQFDAIPKFNIDGVDKGLTEKVNIGGKEYTGLKIAENVFAKVKTLDTGKVQLDLVATNGASLDGYELAATGAKISKVRDGAGSFKFSVLEDYGTATRTLDDKSFEELLKKRKVDTSRSKTQSTTQVSGGTTSGRSGVQLNTAQKERLDLTPAQSEFMDHLVDDKLNSLLGSIGWKPEDIGPLFNVLEEAELTTLNQYAADPNGLERGARAKTVLSDLKSAVEALDTHGKEALAAFQKDVFDPDLKSTAQFFLKSAAQGVQAAERLERARTETNAVLNTAGLTRIPVAGDGNCFFHAVYRNLAQSDHDAGTAGFVRGELAKYAQKERGKIESGFLRYPLDLSEATQKIDQAFLKRLSGDGKTPESWGELAHARILAAEEDTPVVIIAPAEQGGSKVLLPDLSWRALKTDSKDEVFGQSKKPIVLVFNGLNHWEAAKSA